MQPSKEYLDQIAKRLEKLNPHLTPDVVKNMKRGVDSDYSDPIDWLGQSASNYLKNKKDPEIKPDPLFPDRNTY